MKHQTPQNALRLIALAMMLLSLIQPAAADQVITTTTAYAYDPTTGLMTKQTTEPDSADPLIKVETVFGYDSFGNRRSTTITASSCSQ